MKFEKVDLKNWERSENYNWFTTQNKCEITMTANLDITNLIKIIKETESRCYPVFAYVVSRVINKNKEFKMGYDKDHNLGFYDIVHPRYPIFHEEDKRISVLWTEYNENFKTFYNDFIYDIKTYGDKRSMAAKGSYPQNCFDVTSIPWVSFTNFSCPSHNDYIWLAPFVAVGKFFEDEKKIMLPISITSHHAVSDGYHISVFFDQLKSLVTEPLKWFNI